MSTDPPRRLASAVASYWPLRLLTIGPGSPAEQADELVIAVWHEEGAHHGEAERVVAVHLRRVQELEADQAAGPDARVVLSSWFNPHTHRWAGWWDRDPFPFDRLKVADEATQAAADRALAELALPARAVVVLHDVADWSPVAARSLLGLSDEHYLALLHAARSHVRRALERLVDIREALASEGTTDAGSDRDLADYDISCDRLTGLTTQYLEGVIQPRLRATFEEHMVVCPPCVKHVSQLRTTLRVLAALARRPVPPAVKAELTSVLFGA